MKKVIIASVLFLTSSLFAVPCNNAQKKLAVEHCSIYANGNNMTFNKNKGVKECNIDEYKNVAMTCSFYLNGQEVTETMTALDSTITKKDQCSEDILVLVNASCDANAKAKPGFKSGKSTFCATNNAGITSYQCLAIKINNSQVSLPGTFEANFSMTKY